LIIGHIIKTPQSRCMYHWDRPRGLAIAREIGQSHGAELTVESAVAKGSTFTVRLQRSAADRSIVYTPSEQSA
jgi:light-regulated signal transduction histidine kinase (bacteriophytochrome)